MHGGLFGSEHCTMILNVSLVGCQVTKVTILLILKFSFFFNLDQQAINLQ